MQADWSTIGKRLRWAIEQRPAEGRKRGVRKFESDLTDRSNEQEADGRRAIPGVTMPSIQGYLKDDVRPSLDFLEAAADLCGVDDTWLKTGKGHGPGYPNEDHAEAARTASATVSAQIVLGDIFTLTGSEPGLSMLHRRVFEEVGRPLTDNPPPWLAGLMEVWLQLGESGDSDGVEDFEAVVIETLMGPLRRMECDPVEMYRARNFDAYVFAMTPVMLMLAAERTRQNLDAEEVD